MDAVVGILVALIMGYVVALGVYLAATFALAFFLRTLMMDDKGPRPMYFVGCGIAWLASATAAAYVITIEAPFVPLAFSIFLGLGLLLILAAKKQVVGPDQSHGTAVVSMGGVVCGIALGTIAALGR